MGDELAVTHELLREGQKSIQRALEAHMSRTENNYNRLAHRTDEAAKISQANAVALACIKMSVDTIMETRGEHIRVLENITGRVDALETIRDKHEGERGVFSSLMNSNVVGWIVACAAAVWAFVTHSTTAIAK